ncbi:MAG: ABC transporter ATP-binding protein, partial [Ignavibacteria bacterium]
MNSIIEIENLVKSYGEVKAVKGIDLNIQKGEMFGLVGPDGAGKTTIIRTLCGLLSPDKGNISILNLDLVRNRRKIQKSIGYLSQKFSLYADLSVDENIEFFAEIHNITDYKARRDELLKFTRLIDFRDRLTDKLSGGMKQKLALACSLIHKPEILFLDEPTTGVDPVSRRDFWKILSTLQSEGLTIFMTTPYLDEAERCNRVALMNEGKIIRLDTPQNIKASLSKTVVEIVCDDIKKAYKILSREAGNDVQIFGDRINIGLDYYEEGYPLIESELQNENVKILNHRIITPSLEYVFI